MSPRYVGPFEILRKVGVTAYQLALPLELEGVHDTFHIFRLRKYVPDPSHVIDYMPLQIAKNITYQE